MARPRLLTDDEILAATQSCLFEYGPSVSTTMIAERAGISQAALFKRFGTKERLIISALRQPMQRNPIVDRLEMGPQAGPIRAQLIELGVAMIGVMRRVVPCLAMLHSAGLSLEWWGRMKAWTWTISPSMSIRSGGWARVAGWFA